MLPCEGLQPYKVIQNEYCKTSEIYITPFLPNFIEVELARKIFIK